MIIHRLLKDGLSVTIHTRFGDVSTRAIYTLLKKMELVPVTIHTRFGDVTNIRNIYAF